MCERQCNAKNTHKGMHAHTWRAGRRGYDGGEEGLMKVAVKCGMHMAEVLRL